MIERIRKAIRGGSWAINVFILRVSDRLWRDPAYSFNDDGFRLVVRIKEKEE